MIYSRARAEKRWIAWCLECKQVLSEAGGSLALAVINGRLSWPPGDPYPEDARDLVRYCLAPDPLQRPHVTAVVARAQDLLTRC